MRVLMVMKHEINWPDQDLNTRSQDMNQLAASQLVLPRKRSRTGQITQFVKGAYKKTNQPHISYMIVRP
jgi:hypothetical protein